MAARSASNTRGSPTPAAPRAPTALDRTLESSSPMAVTSASNTRGSPTPAAPRAPTALYRTLESSSPIAARSASNTRGSPTPIVPRAPTALYRTVGVMSSSASRSLPVILPLAESDRLRMRREVAGNAFGNTPSCGTKQCDTTPSITSVSSAPSNSTPS